MSQAFFEIKNVCKSFHSVKAVNDVSFSINKGEVHALCGENGAGKSTLMNLISGVYRYDSGQMLLEGRPYSPKNPAEARKAGVSIVFQELSMFSLQSTDKNIFAGKEIVKGGRLAHKQMMERTQKVLDEMDLSIDMKTPVQFLTIGQRQWIEIARAIADDAKILILDEPNSALNMYETRILFQLIQDLKAKGMTIIYISHRMDEVFELADRITVMRDGRYIETLVTKDATVDQVIALMLGHDAKCVFNRTQAQKGQVVLQAEHLSIGSRVKDISFAVRAGEVLGFSGLAGCGYENIIKVLFGLERFTEGQLVLDGEAIAPKTPLEAMRKHIAMVPCDRRDMGLMTDWSILRNMEQSLMRLNSKGDVIQRKTNRQITEEYIKRLNVVCKSAQDQVMNLSGGNQQKVLLGKWLATNPRLLILDDPTRGVDVGAKQEIYKLIDTLTQQGFAVILTSSEIDELTALSDNIILMRNGRHIATVPGGTPKGVILKHIAGETGGEDKRTREAAGESSNKEEKGGAVARTLRQAAAVKEGGVLLALIAVMAIFSAFIPSFLSGQNFAIVLKQMSILAILTFGMTFVFCAGEVDLSVGWILNSTMACMALLMTQTGLNPWLAVVVGLAFSTCLGAVNGILAISFNLPTIVVTLGTVSIYRGLALALNGGRTISGLPEGSFLLLARTRILGISALTIVALAVFAACAWAFKNTRFARHLLLMGDNAQAATKRGINTKRLRVMVMALSGFLSGLGAMLALSNLTSADTTTGAEYAMSAIGAVVIGGTKMGGGSGTMWGSLIGIILVTMIQNGLIFLGLQSGWRSLFIGVTMVGAIIIDTMVERRANRKLTIAKL